MRWEGEENRILQVRRCPAGVYGVLTGSNEAGIGFNISISSPEVFDLLRALLVRTRTESLTQKQEVEVAIEEERRPVCVKCGNPLEVAGEISMEGTGHINNRGMIVITKKTHEEMGEILCISCDEKINLCDLTGWDFPPDDDHPTEAK